MVTRLLLAALCAATVAACSNGDAPADEAVPVTSADLAAAKPLTGDKARLDTLTLRYKAGEVYRYIAKQTSTGGPDTAFMEQRSSHVYTKRIKGVRSDGTFEIGMTFDSIAINVTVKDKTSGALRQEQHFNSGDSAMRKDEQFSQFTALLGEEVTILLRPNATIQEVSGVTSIVNKIAAGRPMPNETREQYARQIELAVYATFIEQEYLRFPNAPVDSTRSWSTSNSAPLMNVFVATSSATYTIESVKDVKGRRVASVKADLTGTVKTTTIPPQAKISITMGASTITGVGRTVIDADKGYTISKTNEITTDISAVVKSTSTGETQSIGQHMFMRTTVELLR